MGNINKITQKWGFGMAPISSLMQSRYDCAVESMIGYMEDVDVSMGQEDISEVKGMFNRCVRQDQWDWFSVHHKFGFPPLPVMRKIVQQLVELRKAFVPKEDDKIYSCLVSLNELNFLEYLKNFQNDIVKSPIDGNRGWIYILSTREQPNILKIGMTRRSVVERVKEINSATGVIFPFSARKIFRVEDAPKVEKEIFQLLSEYRVRKDREFFRTHKRGPQKGAPFWLLPLRNRTC
jgi:hypothetical protein